MNKRVNPFANIDEAPVFTVKPIAAKQVQKETIDQIAKEHNFPSRQATKTPSTPRREPRVYRTGRNQHLGIKATAETIERFYKAADAKGIPLGEMLKQALDAWDRAGSRAN